MVFWGVGHYCTNLWNKGPITGRWGQLAHMFLTPRARSRGGAPKFCCGLGRPGAHFLLPSHLLPLFHLIEMWVTRSQGSEERHQRFPNWGAGSETTVASSPPLPQSDHLEVSRLSDSTHSFAPTFLSMGLFWASGRLFGEVFLPQKRATRRGVTECLRCANTELCLWCPVMRSVHTFWKDGCYF